MRFAPPKTLAHGAFDPYYRCPVCGAGGRLVPHHQLGDMANECGAKSSGSPDTALSCTRVAGAMAARHAKARRSVRRPLGPDRLRSVVSTRAPGHVLRPTSESPPVLRARPIQTDRIAMVPGAAFLAGGEHGEPHVASREHTAKEHLHADRAEGTHTHTQIVPKAEPPAPMHMPSDKLRATCLTTIDDTMR